MCWTKSKIRSRIAMPKTRSADTHFVLLVDLVGRSFSLTLQCSAPSAHIAARLGTSPCPPPPSLSLLPYLTLWALVRHIGKSFWQNCGTKGARYCIADGVWECMCLYVCLYECVFVCVRVCVGVCLLQLLHFIYQYKCTYHKHVWSLPFPQVNSLRCIDSCQSRHIVGFLSSVSCGRCTK